MVSINGVLQVPTYDYTVSNNALAFNEMLPSGERIEVRHLVNNSESIISNGATVLNELTDVNTDYITTGSMGIGIGALVNQQSTAIGKSTTIGLNAGRALTTGGNVTAIGNHSAEDITVGNHIIAIGVNAGAGIITGNTNIVIGDESLIANTDNVSNTVVIGHHSVTNNGVSESVIVGNNTCSAINTSSKDVIIGNGIGNYLVNSSDNVIIGKNSASSLENGNKNIVIGSSAGNNLVNGNNNIVIGYNNACSAGNANNEITIGNVLHTTFRYYGTMTSLSDSRDKTNIQDLDIGLEFLKDLRPVKFDWDARNGRNDKNDIGFVAQEIKMAEEKHNIGTKIVDDSNPDELTVSMMKLIPVLVNTVKQLSDQLSELQKDIETIRKDLSEK
jgi:hypothetical protein